MNLYVINLYVSNKFRLSNYFFKGFTALVPNICWNNGHYDYSEAKCICNESTYGEYCEYCILITDF